MTEKSAIIRHLRNPAYGLLPMLLFAVLAGLVNTLLALMLALALSLFGMLLIQKQSRLLYEVSVITFSVTILLRLLLKPIVLAKEYMIVELVFVLMLTVLHLSFTKILRTSINLNAKNYLAESSRVAFQTQYALSVHLILLLAYFIFITQYMPVLNVVMIKIIPSAIIVFIILAETIRLKLLREKLTNEEWLPVVTESGNVMGKVAKSVSVEMKNRFLHPVVRVALIHNGKIYLKERPFTRLLNPGLLDYPFEKYMKFDHNIDETVHNAIKKEIGSDDIPLKFLLKYVFENDRTKRLIFLYVSVVDDEEKFAKLHLKNGKLWPQKQITDNIKSKLFSECFELEFEYLKNTVLLAHNVKQVFMPE